jgi:hypothetical protein
MLGLDQMTEQELLAELYRLAEACERLNREIAHAAQRRQFSKDSHDGIRAAQGDQNLLAEMNRLMARRRAVEGHLMRVRGQIRPLNRHEFGEG